MKMAMVPGTEVEGTASELTRRMVDLTERLTTDLQAVGELVPRIGGSLSARIEFLRAVETMSGYVPELHGLYVDSASRIVFYHGREARLTGPELQLLNFLLDHPHRFYTADQIMARAWAEASLDPKDVSHYVSRTRKILKRLGMPCDVVKRHGYGYGLTFATDTQRTVAAAL